VCGGKLLPRIGKINEYNYSFCMSRTTHIRQVTILTQGRNSSAVHLHFTPCKGRLNQLFTPFSLPPRAPNIILKLLKLIHLGKSLYLLVFSDVCRLILIELKCQGSGDECRALWLHNCVALKVNERVTTCGSRQSCRPVGDRSTRRLIARSHRTALRVTLPPCRHSPTERPADRGC